MYKEAKGSANRTHGRRAFFLTMEKYSLLNGKCLEETNPILAMLKEKGRRLNLLVQNSV